MSGFVVGLSEPFGATTWYGIDEAGTVRRLRHQHATFGRVVETGRTDIVATLNRIHEIAGDLRKATEVPAPAPSGCPRDPSPGEVGSFRRPQEPGSSLGGES